MRLKRESPELSRLALAISISSDIRGAMRVATNHSLAANKKEPLAELIGRIRQAFLDAGQPEPAIRFTLTAKGGSKAIRPSTGS